MKRVPSESTPSRSPSDDIELLLSEDDVDVRLSGLFPVVSPIVSPDTALDDCLRTVSRGGRGLALVVEPDGERPVGIVDSESILQSVLKNPGKPPQAVRDVMKPCEDYIARPQNPSEALKIMDSRSVPLLILVNRDQSFQGIVSGKDLLESETKRLRKHASGLDKALKLMRDEMRAIQEENAEVMSMLAHDLRGPLGGIQGIAGILVSDGDTLEREQMKDFSKIVSEQIGDLLTLVQDVLELTRCRSGKLPLNIVKCNPHVLLYDASLLYQKLASRKSVSFELKLPEDRDAEIMADPERLKTVLANLMDNAVKYCKAGEEVRVSAEQSNRHFVYEVADNGQGLPKEELSQLFVRFGRGSSTPTGGEPSTGLGLAIAREIVQAHGGTITVTGDQGKGLTFKVVLPHHDTFAVSSSSRKA